MRSQVYAWRHKQGPQLNDEGCAGRLEGLDLELSSDGDSDDTDDEAASMTACDGTFEEIGLDL